MPQREFQEAFLLSKNNTFQNNSLYSIKQLAVITKAVWLIISNENKHFQRIPGNMYFFSRVLEYTYRIHLHKCKETQRTALSK